MRTDAGDCTNLQCLAPRDFEVGMTNSRFQLERVQGAPVSSDELMADIRSVAERAGTRIVSQKLYSELGKFDPSTASRHFGTWNKAVIAAGLEVANDMRSIFLMSAFTKTSCAYGSITDDNHAKPN